jgi:hypothetical protein
MNYESYESDDDRKVGDFLRSHRPDVPAAPVGELKALLGALSATAPHPARRAFPVWAPVLAVLLLALTWMAGPVWRTAHPVAPAADISLRGADTASFALASLAAPVEDDVFIMSDHPLSGLAEDDGVE